MKKAIEVYYTAEFDNGQIIDPFLKVHEAEQLQEQAQKRAESERLERQKVAEAAAELQVSFSFLSRCLDPRSLNWHSAGKQRG